MAAMPKCYPLKIKFIEFIEFEFEFKGQQEMDTCFQVWRCSPLPESHRCLWAKSQLVAWTHIRGTMAD